MKVLKKSYFVLYDANDFPICFFEDFWELLKCINYNKYELIRRFKENNKFIKIVINSEFYKLYRFTD